MIWFSFACALLGLIFVCTRYEMKHFFHTCLRWTRNPRLSLWLFALIYAPGTLIHELAHYFTSIVLFVRPHAIHIIPSIHEHDGGYKLTLGAVHSTKTDPLRSLLIGTAPLYWGLGLLYVIFAYNVLPQETFAGNACGIYGLYVLSSCMFLSKQDLKHSFIIIPLALFGGAYIYVSRFSIAGLHGQPIVVEASQKMTYYLGIVVAIHLAICSFIYLLNRQK